MDKKDIDWTEVNHLLESGMEDGLFPGAALHVTQGNTVLRDSAHGFAELEPKRRVANVDTIWDLASLTKILCTAPLFLKLAIDQKLFPDTQINTILDDFPSNITIGDCLSHSSGLPSWRPLYAATIRQRDLWGSSELRARILNMACQTPLETMPQAAHSYSDIGFLILCATLERFFNARIDQIWEQMLPSQARSSLTWFPQKENVAATERCPVRGKVVVGDVHDLNAAALGGPSTHAGLFGTAKAAAQAALWPMSLLNSSKEHEREMILKFWTQHGAGSHVLGWDTPSPQGSSASNLWPSDGVGHLGFTGCSIWIAPTEQISVVFLSNRVHPEIPGGAVPSSAQHPKSKAFRAFRPKLHKAIYVAAQLIVIQIQALKL